MRHQGFTLVELSVVIAIIALLAGGIVMGKSVMRAAELRTVLSTLDEYTQAIGKFQEKYGELPGDMSRATQVWGAHATCPGSNLTPSVGVETCDGNGDGFIGHNPSVAPTNNWLETYRAWQHLAASGLITGRFTGVPSNTGFPSIAEGVNVADGKVTGTVVAVTRGVDAGNGTVFPSNYGNYLEFGKVSAPSGTTSWSSGGAISGKELFNLDAKIDDGLPATGKVMEYRNAARPECVSSDDPATAIYRRDLDVRSCHIIYKTGY
jgi:prepilin-type N-terminal cleavage/methylation domain-containing protein